MGWAGETPAAAYGGRADDVPSTWASAFGGLFDAAQRSLAAAEGGGSTKLDYTVLSVALFTLGLIWCVEIVRHKIDQRAHGHPFAQTVLESAYRELSTLGIVEFGIFLGHTYAKNFNVKIEAVFAKVHFLLFFTAIINALMSVLLSVVASRISDRMWVQTEELELNHYIAIREEFYRVEKKMGQFETASDERTAEHVAHFRCDSIRWAWVRLRQTIKYPLLKRKYDKLLVQVRFHELRVHFLKANDLPSRFKVSDYLVKSELHVFKKMVHISTFAWIMVAAAVNLCYFLMGMVAYVSESQTVVGTWMTWIYISACISFIPISYLIFWKMKRIFSQIMQMKLIDHNVNDDDESIDSGSINPNELDEPLTPSGSEGRTQVPSASLSKQGAVKGSALDQLDLFWGSDPHFIIGAFQFMQLGYAIAASILLIFWDYMNVYYASVEAKFFVVALVACYGAFLYIMAQVVPRYTLCTSLGQLVNRRRLHETLAKCKLEEARRKRRHQIEEQEINAAMAKEADRNAKKRKSFVPPTVKEMRQRSQERLESSSRVDPPASARATLPRRSRATAADDDNDRHSDSLDSERMHKLAELVETSTRDLPSLRQTDVAGIRRERRRNRLKSVSDGVAFMRNVTERGVSDAAANVLGSASDEKKTTPPVELGPAKAEAAAKSDLLPTAPPPVTKRRRPRRVKSVSANVALMRSPTASLFASGDAPRFGEEKEEEKPATLTRISSRDGLPSLMEDIPSRSVRASELFVPLGRSSKLSKLSGPKSGDGPGLAESTQTAVALENDESTGKGRATQNSQTTSQLGNPVGQSRDVVVINEGPGDNDAADTNAGDEADKGEHEKDDDDDTIGTAESEGNRSDFDDVPEVAASVRSLKTEEAVSAPTVSDRIRSLFFSQRYRLVSAVFGTMIALFLVGMRVEILLIASGTITDNENTWHLGRYSGAFWWEVAWLSAFIVVSMLSFFVFSPRCRENDHFHMVVACIYDLTLTSVCLVLLLWAEVERCCQSDPAVCCPKFGTRDYGGLGNIEPFTSLICLRVFRFQFGRLMRKLVRRSKIGERMAHLHPTLTATARDRKRLSQACSDTFMPGHNDGQKRQSSFHDANETHDNHGHGKNFESETGTIVELWKAATGMYPDIIEKYGEFSGELLQAMLGIEVIENVGVQSDLPTKLISPRSDISDGGLSPKSYERDEKYDSNLETLFSPALSRQTSAGATPKEENSNIKSPTTLKLSRRFTGLDPEAQGVILAGKVGMPVKARHNRGESVDSLVFLTADTPPTHSGEKGLELCPLPKKSAPPEFELDTKQNIEEHNDDDEPSLLFVDPNARLIRSMRRCERRLPPMLNEWAVVDVVLTKYEVVYFDANDVDDIGNIPSELHPLPEDRIAAAALQKRRHTVREALIATKGGKGLRLRDVSVGRKVVGHLELADIDYLKVERFPAVPRKAKDGDNDDNFVDEEDKKEVKQGEYWSHPDSSVDTQVPRKQRWKHIMEDRLKLHSMQGALYLRFFSDLEEWETSPHEDEVEAEVEKNDTLLWCQTVARLCGTEQLHQKLPHFGEEGSAELVDFIDFISRDNDNSIPMHVGGAKNFHRRIRSRVNLAQLGEMIPQRSGHNRSRSEAPVAVSKLEIINGGEGDAPVRGRASSVELASSISARGRRTSSVRFVLDSEGKGSTTEDIGLPV